MIRSLRASRAGLAAVLTTLVLVVGCRDEAGPDVAAVRIAPPASRILGPTVLTFDSAGPALADGGVTSAWVKDGSPADLRLTFTTGEEFAHLKLNPNSLGLHPDGTPFTPGDSVLITMQVLPGDSMMVDFQPAGIVFDPRHPAELTFNYQDAGDDLDHDGHGHTLRDDVVESSLSIWHQAFPGAPLDPRLTEHDQHGKSLSTSILGFSRYAIAY